MDCTACELATNVVYNNFQDIIVDYPLGAIQCSRGYIQGISQEHLHTFQLFMQLKQQTSGHSNILHF